MIFRLLSKDGKSCYDALTNSSNWWRFNKYNMWIETRLLVNESDDEYNCVDDDAPMILWMGNGFPFFNFTDGYGTRQRSRSLTILDRMMLYHIAWFRLRHEKKDRALLVIRKLNNQILTR